MRYFLGEEEWEFSRATDGSGGYDLRFDVMKNSSHPCEAFGDKFSLSPGGRALIGTGLCLSIPKGVIGQVVSRSGLAINNGVIVLNAPGIIDSDYRGEIAVMLINTSSEWYWMKRGDRIAQIVFTPVLIDREINGDLYFGLGAHQAPSLNKFIRVSDLNDLDKTDRGSGGFGSTGR